MPGKAVGMPGIHPGREDALLGLVPTDSAPRDGRHRTSRRLSELDRRNVKRGGGVKPNAPMAGWGGGASGVAIGNPYVISSSSLVVVFVCSTGFPVRIHVLYLRERLFHHPW